MDILTPTNPVFDDTHKGKDLFTPSAAKQMFYSENSLKDVLSKRSLMHAESSKKKSNTFDDTTGWKGEVDIDSMLGSATTSHFERLIDEYYNVQDSGLKFSATDSRMSYDSNHRRLKFRSLKAKPSAKWAKDEYIKAVCRLQRHYVKNGCYGDEDVILNKQSHPVHPQQIELLMKDLGKSRRPSTRRLETI